MKSRIIEVYEWNDIKEEICNRMGVDPKEFHSYQGHNLWHVAINIILPNISNGAIMEVYPFWDDDELKDVIEDEDKITQLFIETFDGLLKELADGQDQGVWVEFSW